MLHKIKRLFVIKNRFEAYLIIFALALGAMTRGAQYTLQYPGVGGYLLFAAAIRPALKEELMAALDEGEKLKGTDVVTMIAARWKELDAAKKLEWNEKAKPASSDEEA